MNNKKFAIKKVTLSSTAVSIIWEDNKKSVFHFLWLRDNCPTSFHPDTRMRIFNILSVSKDIYPMKIKEKNNKLIIHWSENNHISKYDLKWLRSHCYTNKNNQRDNSIQINNKSFVIPKIHLNKDITNFSNNEINEALIFNRNLLMENFIIPNKLKIPLFRNMLEKYYI